MQACRRHDSACDLWAGAWVQGLKEIIKMQSIVMMDEGEEGSMRLLVASLRDPAELADLAAEVGG